jgi:hypothetical protein
MNTKLSAIRALCSWLDASNVAYKVDGTNITINNVAIDLDDKTVGSLLSTNLEAGIGDYKKLLKLAGVDGEVVLPVDRGVSPIKKVYDDPILARFRHREFRTAPNNEGFLRNHNRVIERECRIFQSKNRRLCAELGYEFEDLRSYAQVWATTFAHRSAVMVEGDDNDKLLTRYLRQRFTELFNSLVAERRGSLPEKGVIDALQAVQADDDVDEAWVEAHDQIKSKSLANRKRKATVLLEENLNALGHDKMVETLEETTKHPCPDSAKMARKKLREHIVSCDSCKARLAKEAV